MMISEISLLQKDLKESILSGSLVFSLVLFYVLIGFVVWISPAFNLIDQGKADLQVFFDLLPLILMFFIPAMTMGLFSNEKKNGTIDLLRLSKLSSSRIVWTKALSAIIVFLLALIPTLIYPYLIDVLSYSEVQMDYGALFGSYMGVLLIGLVFTSVGVLSGILMESQPAAFLLGLIICMILYFGLNGISSLVDIPANVKYWIQYIGLHFHYKAISTGALHLSDLIFFVTLFIFLIYLSSRILSYKLFQDL